MRWDKKRKASLTLYLTLTLVLSVFFILALLEAARAYGVHARASEVTNLILESSFGEYQPVLWDKYGFLALDASRNLEESMSGLAYDNLNDTVDTEGTDLYRMQTDHVEIKSYQLVTDRNGAAFEEQVASFMKKEMGEQAAKQLLQKITGMQSEEGNSGLDDKMSSADAALKEISEAQQSEAQQVEPQQSKARQVESGMKKGSAQESESSAENPIDVVSRIRQQGMLAVVVPGHREVSTGSIDGSNSLLKRQLKKGTYSGSSQNSWYERILLQKFITTRFKNFINSEDMGGLTYELEYILCGNDSDKENLEGTVGRILLLRETVNYAYLLTDEAKMAEALALAVALAGVSVNPAVIEIVRQGIIAAWACVESISDVRCLLSEGRVPLLKTAVSWKTQLSNCSEAMQNESEDKSGEGYSYEEYLQKMLYALSLKHITYRTMDLMESKMRQVDGFKDTKMDEMVQYISITARYDVQSVFAAAMGNKDAALNYFIQKDAVFSYY